MTSTWFPDFLAQASAASLTALVSASPELPIMIVSLTGPLAVLWGALLSELLKPPPPQALPSACRAAAGLLDVLGRGAAIVCASDALALGVWRVLVGRGLEPGVDVGLVCFDDTDIAHALDLSSLRQPLDRVADRVLQMLATGSDSRDPAGGLLLPPELVVRSSSKPAGNRTNRKEK